MPFKTSAIFGLAGSSDFALLLAALLSFLFCAIVLARFPALGVKSPGAGGGGGGGGGPPAQAAVNIGGGGGTKEKVAKKFIIFERSEEDTNFLAYVTWIKVPYFLAL